MSNSENIVEKDNDNKALEKQQNLMKKIGKLQRFDSADWMMERGSKSQLLSDDETPDIFDRDDSLESKSSEEGNRGAHVTAIRLLRRPSSNSEA